jgi:hypothetical protein
VSTTRPADAVTAVTALLDAAHLRMSDLPWTDQDA